MARVKVSKIGKDLKKQAKEKTRKTVEMPAPVEVQVKLEPDEYTLTYRDAEKEAEADRNACGHQVMSVSEYVRSIRPDVIEDIKPKIEPIVKEEPPNDNADLIPEIDASNSKDDEGMNEQVLNNPTSNLNDHKNKIMKRVGSTTEDEPSSRKTKTCKTNYSTTADATSKIRRIKKGISSTFGIYHAETTDVNFVFDVDGGEEFVSVHKCILAAQSPVFRRMFYESELKETGDIKLTDTTADAFINFMEFLYNAKIFYTISCSKIEISALVYLAYKYDVNWLEVKCKDVLSYFMDERAQAVLWILPLVDLCKYNELQRKCINNIRTHGNQIINSDEFVHCEKSVMNKILDTDFVGRNEVKVFEKCIEWAKRQCEEAKLDPESPGILRSQLGDCFKLIRFGSMSSHQFVKCLSVNVKVFTPDEIQALSSNMSETYSNGSWGSQYVDSARDFLVKTQMYSDGKLLKTLFQDQTTADVTLIFKNAENKVTKRFPSHKCILARRSKFFADQIKNLPKPNQEIHIADVWSSTFEAFLEMIYTIDITQCYSFMENIPHQCVDAILSLAKEYRVLHIIGCFDFYYYVLWNSKDQNVMWCYNLAHKYSMDSTKRRCVEVLKINGDKAIASEAFVDIRQQTLKSVLELRAWKNGKLVVDACIKWAEKHCEKNQLDPAKPENLRTALGDAIELIPFSAMDPLEFIDFQRDYDTMFTAEEVRKVFNTFAQRKKKE